MRPRTLLALLALAAAPGAARAQSPTPLAFARLETATPAKVRVVVPALDTDASLPLPYSGYGKNIAPAVGWSGAPPGVRAWALMVEDPDGGPPTPVIHWLAWNIPAALDGLPRGMHNEAEPKRFPGLRQGVNSHGGLGWTGPHPPVGDPPHHYHVEVFALDRPLKLKGGADREALIRALKGRVLARGEATALYAQAPDKPRGG